MASITETNISVIRGPTIPCVDGKSYSASSLKGRAVCLVHLIATPLKALSGVGKLTVSVANAALAIFKALTLNASPKSSLIYAVTEIADVLCGTITLPFALLANVVRCAVGVIFHPGAMIRNDSAAQPQPTDFRSNMFLYGTVVNY